MSVNPLMEMFLEWFPAGGRGGGKGGEECSLRVFLAGDKSRRLAEVLVSLESVLV